jgi:hypothetical protein
MKENVFKSAFLKMLILMGIYKYLFLVINLLMNILYQKNIINELRNN